jgi:ABC-type glycerol-3-phosphate transport system substrate-binding protein
VIDATSANAIANHHRMPIRRRTVGVSHHDRSTLVNFAPFDERFQRANRTIKSQSSLAVSDVREIRRPQNCARGSSHAAKFATSAAPRDDRRGADQESLQEVVEQMKRRLSLFLLTVILAGLAVFAAASTRSQAATGPLTIVGPWAGRDAQSFQAVLSDFTAKNPGITVTYKSAIGDVADALKSPLASTPDLAVLSLPDDLAAMSTMAKSGILKPMDFVVPAMQSHYAFSWKLLGSVDNKLFALPFKATNESAIWFDRNALTRAGVAAPRSWTGLLNAFGALRAQGIAPIAISGRNAIALPDLFESLYLMAYGNNRYDRLAAGTLPWTDASVRGTLRLLSQLTRSMAGGPSSLNAGYGAAVSAVFGSPLRAAMVPGGSTALPVLYAAKAARPLSEFDAFAFPRMNPSAPPRVIGTADAVVLTKDSDSARALLAYLSSPEAATVWAKRGGFFLSPNRGVDPSSYGAPAVRSLATSLAAANVFRLAIADTVSKAFRHELNSQLIDYVQHPDKLDLIVGRINTAAHPRTG